jgi:glucokinase
VTRTSNPHLCLVGDIGGTNARLAVADVSARAAKLASCKTFPRANFAGFEDVVELYLREADSPGRPDSIVVAVAGPIKDGEVRLTNGGWTISERALQEQGFAFARLINDYAALALCVEHLGPGDLAPIGGPRHGIPCETVGVVGAGTGLGVAALVRDGGTSSVMVTEGGHITFAPQDESEFEITRLLARRFGRVSMERLLSGPGLSNLRWALGCMSGGTNEEIPPEQITAKAASGTDPLCVQTVERFCTIYGRFAGDMALAFGARAGMYLGGGIAPRMLGPLNAGGFRRAFEDKGRFVGYVANIPTQAIIHPYAALLGSAEAFVRAGSARPPAAVRRF